MPTITNSLNLVVLDLAQGEPVAIPTETVYGLAAMIDKEDAIKKVFALKNRPLNHPLIVHVADGFDLSTLVEDIPDYAQRLIHQFWPGPLTLIFRVKKDAVNPIITGGQSTVAIRCPSHPLAQKILKEIHTPLVAPSANPFGKISPTTAQHVKHSFIGQELTILDGGRCEIGIESTIVDASKPEGYQILRHGVIDAEAIATVAASHPLDNESTIRAPGNLESHYQPQKSLYYFNHYETLVNFCARRPGDVYVIAHEKPATVEDTLFHPLAFSPAQVAFDLYYQLREADQSNAVCIAIELPPDTNEWQGIRERVLKAGFPYSTGAKS
jgi:L-threonylcarbamoyladenylate synthase